MPVFSPKTIFITGAGSGIGRALAIRYAAPQVRIGLLGRRREALEESAAAVRALGAQAYCYVADVTDARQCREAADRFSKEAGIPQVVIANAGISVGTVTTHREDCAVFKEIMDSNWLGTIHIFSAFLPSMLDLPAARLAGIASVAGFRGLPGAGAYSASKAATITYLESLRLELAATGVRVCTICPGYVDTPLTRGNPYPMPWLMPADKAAHKIQQAIDRGQRFYVLPRPMAWIGRILRHLPIGLYDRLFRNAPHKPRRAIKPATPPLPSPEYPMTAYTHLLLAHGSRDARWRVPFERLENGLRQAVPERPIILCYMERCPPSLPSAIETAVNQGARMLRITPLFMAGGGHLERDIPQLVATAQARFPRVDILVDPAIGEATDVFRAIIDYLSKG